MDILVSERITGPAMDALRQQWDVVVEPELWRSPGELQRRLADARALIVRNQTQVTGELIAAAKGLEVIGRAGAGLDNIDTGAAAKAGVIVTYAPRENSISVAELTVGLMLSLARKIPTAHLDTRAGRWNRKTFTGTELYGKTLGIVGLGRIGTMVAQRAAAFEMRLVGHDDFVDPESEFLRECGIELVSLEELLREADVVTAHVPLTEETRGMFGERSFRQMKSSALLINTSRGEIVEEAALADALQHGEIAGAALDVRSSEPPDQSPLDGLDNVVLTPHIAAFTHEAQERVVAAVCRDVSAVLSGGRAVNVYQFG